MQWNDDTFFVNPLRALRVGPAQMDRFHAGPDHDQHQHETTPSSHDHTRRAGPALRSLRPPLVTSSE